MKIKLQARFEKLYEKKLLIQEKCPLSKDSLEKNDFINSLITTLQELEINTILDVGCGDFTWTEKVLFNYNYIGLDIVPSIVNSNKRFETKKIKFIHSNAIDDRFPDCDMIFCNNIFSYLSYKNTHRLIMNLGFSNAKYLITTYHKTPKNQNTLSGLYRQINLLNAPFFFPEPLKIINKNTSSSKIYALWKMNDVRLINQKLQTVY